MYSLLLLKLAEINYYSFLHFRLRFRKRTQLLPASEAPNFNAFNAMRVFSPYLKWIKAWASIITCYLEMQGMPLCVWQFAQCCDQSAISAQCTAALRKAKHKVPGCMRVRMKCSFNTYFSSDCFVLSSDNSLGLFSHYRSKPKTRSQAETSTLEVIKKFF